MSTAASSTSSDHRTIAHGTKTSPDTAPDEDRLMDQAGSEGSDDAECIF